MANARPADPDRRGDDLDPRSVTYFPDASIGGPLAVFAIWLFASAAVAFGFAGRGKEMSDEERRASAGAVAA